jgi:hypothetical protein
MPVREQRAQVLHCEDNLLQSQGWPRCMKANRLPFSFFFILPERSSSSNVSSLRRFSCALYSGDSLNAAIAWLCEILRDSHSNALHILKPTMSTKRGLNCKKMLLKHSQQVASDQGISNSCRQKTLFSAASGDGKCLASSQCHVLQVCCHSVNLDKLVSLVAW